MGKFHGPMSTGPGGLRGSFTRIRCMRSTAGLCGRLNFSSGDPGKADLLVRAVQWLTDVLSCGQPTQQTTGSYSSRLSHTDRGTSSVEFDAVGQRI